MLDISSSSISSSECISTVNPLSVLSACF